MPNDRANAHLADWKQREALAESLIPLLGQLYRERAVVATLFGASIMQKSPTTILRMVLEAEQLAGQTLPMEELVALVGLLVELPVGRSRVDLGKLLVRFGASTETDLMSWATRTVQPLVGAKPMPKKARDVVLYGFGRIGRLVARILINKTGGGDKYRLRAIVLRPSGGKDLAKRASLLRRDSVHGVFPAAITVDEEQHALIVNGNTIRVIYAANPSEVDYTAYGVEDAVIIDNTGKWRDQAALSQHLACPGASKVILTAPGKDLKNIVFGVNQHILTEEDTIVSAASCTTNAIVPVLKVLEDSYGIVSGHLETIHAYTNDQNLIDNFHKKERRGRSAALNMVITSTGAAKAAAKALPSLEGKLTGSAIRVPTPNVSLAILNMQLGAEVTVEALNETLRQTSIDSPLAAQVGYSASPEVVSTDLVGDHHAGTVDAVATLAKGRQAVLYVWYDNEFGYSCQVVRLMQQMAGVSPRVFPPAA